MKKIFFVVIVFTIVLFAACAKKNSALQASRPPSVTYAMHIKPLIATKCGPCHIPAQGGNKADFANYDGARKYATAILARIQLNPGDRGFMPFKNKKLADDQIALVKKWVESGASE